MILLLARFHQSLVARVSSFVKGAFWYCCGWGLHAPKNSNPKVAIKKMYL
jgi:hypothetical protein